MIKLNLLFQPAVNSRTTPFIKNKKNKTTTTTTKRLSYPLPLSIIVDIIRHNIAQMSSISKAYIPCTLAIIIKWCQMTDKDRRQHQWWSLRTTLKTDRNKRLPFAKQNNKRRKNIIISTYLKRLTHTMGRGKPSRSNSMSSILPQWKDEKMELKMMGDDWWNYCGHTYRET